MLRPPGTCRGGRCRFPSPCALTASAAKGVGKLNDTADVCEPDGESELATLARWARTPVRFVEEALKTEPELWQREALLAIAAGDRLAIRSGHGVGKSALLAWITLWFLLTRMPAKVAATAPTGHQLADVLWGEIAKWHRRVPSRFRDRLEVKSDRVVLRRGPGECFAVARTARKEQPEAFQGFHSENMLFLVDEASGVEDIIFEVGEGAMSTPGAKTVLAGNPTRTSGYFFDAFHKRRAQWTCLRVPCATSRLVAARYAEEMAEKYGADSNVYRVRVLGDFPESEDDVVLPLAWLEAAVGRDVAPVEGFRTVWGLDVARFGSDRTALARRRANLLLEPVAAWHGLDLMQVCGRVLAAYEAVADERDLPGEILVDAIGLGAGVVDRLRELGLPAVGINVSEAPSGAERFMRLRDELWWKAREWFEGRACRLPADEALIAELAGPKYAYTSAGKIKVEGKDEMKKRGVVSPDLADAFCLTFAGGVQRTIRHVRTRYQVRRQPRGSWMAA